MYKAISIMTVLILSQLVSCANSQGPQESRSTPGEVESTATSSATETPDLVWLTPGIRQTDTPGPTATPKPIDSGWQTLRPGLEKRTVDLVDGQGARIEHIYILRIDPEIFRFTVAYRSEAPLTLAEWQAQTGALVVINGGYFSTQEERYFPTGLIVVDGKTVGESYGDFAGMLAITIDGPELRWLRQQPYDPQEPLLAGLQSFPILVKPGGELGFSAEHEDHLTARRTVIAEDINGRFIFLVADQGYYTLHQLSLALTNSDLALNMALNLDGGPSSGILLADPYEETTAYSALPMVITVFTKAE